MTITKILKNNNKRYSLINKPVDEVIKYLKKHSIIYRCIKKSDNLSLEYIDDRLNLVIEDDKVMETYRG